MKNSIGSVFIDNLSYRQKKTLLLYTIGFLIKHWSLICGTVNVRQFICNNYIFNFCISIIWGGNLIFLFNNFLYILFKINVIINSTFLSIHAIRNGFVMRWGEFFSVWPRNRIISAGLEPVPSHVWYRAVDNFPLVIK